MDISKLMYNNIIFSLCLLTHKETKGTNWCVCAAHLAGCSRGRTNSSVSDGAPLIPFTWGSLSFSSSFSLIRYSCQFDKLRKKSPFHFLGQIYHCKWQRRESIHIFLGVWKVIILPHLVLWALFLTISGRRDVILLIPKRCQLR